MPCLLWVAALPAQGQPAAQIPVPREKPPVPVAKTSTPVQPMPSQARKRSGATFYEVDGPYEMTWPKEATNQERANCKNLLGNLQVEFVEVDPFGGPGQCGSPAPVEVSAVAGVKISPPATLNCQFVTLLNTWIQNDLQKAARDAFKQPVVSMKNVASYTCRKRRGDISGRMSEHSYANALDIAEFKLENGTVVSVGKDWGGFLATAGISSSSRFLKMSHSTACKRFATVLGPDHNAAHKDHFHLDFGRNGRGGICK